MNHLPMLHQGRVVPAGLSFIVALLLFTGCATTKHVGNFNYYTRHTAGKRSYIILNDGTRVNGSQVTWTRLPSNSEYVAIDNQRFRDSEVKAVSQGGIYFLRHGQMFLKQIIGGKKINVYANISRVSIVEGQYRSPGHTAIVCWLQKDGGKLIRFSSYELLANAVRDCQLSFELIDKSRAELKKLTRNDIDYLNRIVWIYNNDCKPVPEPGSEG